MPRCQTGQRSGKFGTTPRRGSAKSKGTARRRLQWARRGCPPGPHPRRTSAIPHARRIGTPRSVAICQAPAECCTRQPRRTRRVPSFPLHDVDNPTVTLATMRQIEVGRKTHTLLGDAIRDQETTRIANDHRQVVRASLAAAPGLAAKSARPDDARRILQGPSHQSLGKRLPRQSPSRKAGGHAEITVAD